MAYRKDLIHDRHALNIFAIDSAKIDQAREACIQSSPMVTRASIRTTICEKGFAGDLLPALRVKSNCNATIYQEIAAVVMIDLIELTALEEGCNRILNYGNRSTYLNFENAGKALNKCISGL